MIKTIKGYLKQVILVDLNGDSLGEGPHFFFETFEPKNQEIYVSDTLSDMSYLREYILKALYENDIISDLAYIIKMESGGEIIIERKELFTNVNE